MWTHLCLICQLWFSKKRLSFWNSRVFELYSTLRASRVFEMLIMACCQVLLWWLSVLQEDILASGWSGSAAVRIKSSSFCTDQFEVYNIKPLLPASWNLFLVFKTFSGFILSSSWYIVQAPVCVFMCVCVGAACMGHCASPVCVCVCVLMRMWQWFSQEMKLSWKLTYTHSLSSTPTHTPTHAHTHTHTPGAE